MNKSERKVMSRIYDCINRMTALSPSNPADIAGLSKGMVKVNRVSVYMLHALSDLMYGDYDLSLESIKHAEEVLGIE